MYKLFISDLHLEETRPEITEIFLRFLKKHTNKGLSLYILGDFFETWIGDDDISPFTNTVIHGLKQATQNGLRIYVMHGNRDFLLGKRFLKATGCQLLPEQVVIDIYGCPTLLMHGDTLCTDDKKYLKFRKKSRHWLYKKLILLKSLKGRRELAARMRAASKEHTSSTAAYIMDVTQEEVERVMQAHGVNHLIHGHTHREAVHQFNLQNSPATRTVLGAWHTHGSVLICTPEGRKELMPIKFDE